MSCKISGFLNFHVSHLNYEKFKLFLQNILNTLKTTRVYFGVLQAMTWVEFHELFMGKYFLASTRYAKAREFLELKQGMMTMLEYVAKFTELACFIDDYVATDMAKVKKFKDGLKFSIRGKIVGLLLQDMDLMVKTTMTIEREVDDARSIRDADVKDKRKKG